MGIDECLYVGTKLFDLAHGNVIVGLNRQIKPLSERADNGNALVVRDDLSDNPDMMSSLASRVQFLVDKTGKSPAAITKEFRLGRTLLYDILANRTKELSGPSIRSLVLALKTTPSFLMGDTEFDEPRRLSLTELDDEDELDERRRRSEQEPAWSKDSYEPAIPGALPEIDVQLGAGEGQVGEIFELPLGGETISGHKVIGEWLFPEPWLRAEINASPSKTLVMPVVGDSMEPTYRPGDRVLVDLAQSRLLTDTVYVISDGDSAPQIKRLQKVLFSNPIEVHVISDNPAMRTQTVELGKLTVIGRVVGVVSRR